MFCKNCGKGISDTSRFCPYCGTEHRNVQEAQPAPTPAPPLAESVAEQQQPDAPPQEAQVPTPPQQPLDQPYAPPAPQPSQPPYAPVSGTEVQAPAKKKRGKALPIAIAAVIVLVLVAGITLAATGVLSGLFGQKAALVALYEGTENLVFETSSATVEVQAGVDMTLKWDLGEDLAHSTIWGYSGGVGFVFSDDTLYLYESDTSSSSTVISDKTSGIIDAMNEAFSEEYDTSIDLNKIVKDGKFDRAYFDELNRIISEADTDSSDLDAFGLEGDDIDSVRMTEIIDAFMAVEVNKEEVYEQFMSGIEKENRGGVTTHRATIDPMAFFDTLKDYALERGKDTDYANAADELAELCDSVYLLGSYIEDFSIEISVEKNILVGLGLLVNMPSGAVSVNAEVTDINATDLDNDTKLQSILASPLDEGTGGGFGESFDEDFGGSFDEDFGEGYDSLDSWL